MVKARTKVFRNPRRRRKAIHARHVFPAVGKCNNKMEGLNVGRQGGIATPTKRRDSPAIDGMRIRHNARPRTGPGAGRRAPGWGWRSRETTRGSR